MPVKLRNPKARNPLIAPEVMAEAVALFRRGLALQKRGADEIDYYSGETTPDQEEYREVERRLHWTMLKLVGSAGPLDVYPGMPLDGGAPYYRLSYPHAMRLRALLMKEMRARH